MAITFLSNLLSDLYILLHTKNHKYIGTIVCYIAMIIWYFTTIFIHSIYHINIDMIAGNIFLLYGARKSIIYLMEHQHIKGVQKENCIYELCAILILFVNSFDMILYAQKQPYISQVEYMIIASNIISDITNTGMISIITCALYKYMHKILIDNHTTLSHHATIQKIKKFPKFTQQRALIYYTEK